MGWDENDEYLAQETRKLIDRAVAEERSECAAICRRMSAHAKENAARLKEYPGAEDEARCRELASSYLDEAAFLMDMRSNVQGEGAPERSGGNPQAPLAGAPSRPAG